ncbi:BA14K family protein [Cohaesibacter celericrescens]|uniref:Lectin-like protein BA14k n=1 Tax=Cohaesibacter celericrescens TaxID=2067669 RepID=A0A2N5XW58_9HYPH|nr:BA14K family protein [Cohaesibacter celericrescens]PLW78734.1 hypothetical protein C0081_00345 [Cohaesibacter celericrescens]
MTGRKILIYALLAAILPALAIVTPTTQAEAKNGRKGALAAGLIIGAVGAAVLYNGNKNKWNRVQNHYHRNGFRGCHTHNGVRHCHNARNQRPTKNYREAPRRNSYRPEPWTREWRRYCRNKYRSFNPRTGYYTKYSGRKAFCR